MARSGRSVPLGPDSRLRESTPLSDESAEGVDRTLIRWMLALTPDQRLEALQAFTDSVWALRHARRS